MKEESIWVMDFPNQLIREKVILSRPPNYTGHSENGQAIQKYLDNLKEYEKHVASRRTFSYPVSKEQDGKEIPESEFRLQHQATPVSEYGTWYDIPESSYLLYREQNRRIIAIPIDNIGETDRQYEDKKEGESGLRTALEWLLDAIPGQTNDADWWPDELTTAVKNAKWALSSPPDPASKEQEGDGLPDFEFTEWASENNWKYFPGDKKWRKNWTVEKTTEQLYQLYKKKP